MVRTNLWSIYEKTRELVDAENLRSPCSEEIRELVNPHFSFTRGRVKFLTTHPLPTWYDILFEGCVPFDKDNKRKASSEDYALVCRANMT